MANLLERRNKDGVLTSYTIRAYRGRDAEGKLLKPYTTSFKVDPKWSEKTARKKAEAYAIIFEKECKEGTLSDSNKRFDEYCKYVLDLKEQRQMVKRSTIDRERQLADRVNSYIGHIKLKQLRPEHLNKLYTTLSEPGQNLKTGGNLSPKTVLEHHRLISSVLSQAVKEGLIPYNVAQRAVPPKVSQKEVNYFQPDQIDAIRDALETEPIKWKTLVHMLLITGARRGEILGLKWNAIDFDNNRIHIYNSVLYTPVRGIYEETPKTPKSNRYISMPKETMNLLKEYHLWQLRERARLGDFYTDQGFVFTQHNGNPMHPDDVPNYLSKFSKKYDLPHINAHAFRHTMASMLYYNGVDSVSISKRLGHAQVSTTANIYAHIIEDADKKNADIIADIFLREKERKMA